MADHFASPKQLISHARDEIKAAADLVAEYARSQRGTRVVHDDPVARQKIHCVRIAGPAIPPKLTNIVKDAAGNLRDALDHAVYSAAVVIVGGEPKDTGFPFAKDAAGVQGELGSPRLAGNPPEIRPCLEGFQPYKGGNDALWAMNQIRNPNTHRFIVPVASAAMTRNIGISEAMFTGTSEFGYSRWDAAKNEVEFMRVSRDSYIDYQVRIAIGVTFEGIEAVAGKLLIPTLNLMASETERVVLAVEAECRRLGFIA